MTIQGVPPRRLGVVQVRLIGAEEDVERAIQMLMQLGAQFSRPHAGRSGEEFRTRRRTCRFCGAATLAGDARGWSSGKPGSVPVDVSGGCPRRKDGRQALGCFWLVQR
jgi:hypothetical protein